MKRDWLSLLICLLIIAFCNNDSFAQITTGQIAGTVEDESGAIVPSSDILLEDIGTGVKRSIKGADNGVFNAPGLQVGLYKVTITVKGFQTAIYTNIKVDAGRTTDIKVALKIGSIGETVQVVGGAEVLERTSTAIQTTVRGDQIRSLPLNNRDTLDFVLLQPGAQMGGSARQSTFNGLPKGALNVTMDGLNIQDTMLKSSFGGGMFTLIRPRLDAIEEVSVSTAAGTAGQNGDGAVQIQFTTRRGKNELHGLAFFDHRNEFFNANTWINNARNLPKQRNLLNVFGGNLGGPILKNKIFFFFNYEEFRLPESRPRENVILTDAASRGIFTYKNTAGNVVSKNLLTDISGATATVDPAIKSMLDTINGVRGKGAITSFDLFRERYRFDAPSFQKRIFPTLRLDYQITDSLSWNGIWHYNYFTSSPDTLNNMDQTFPGIGSNAGQYSNRYALSNSLQWIVTPNITNEVRFGFQGAPNQFFREADTSQFPSNLRFVWPLNVSSLHTRPAAAGTVRSLPSSRNTPFYSFQDNVNILKGKHTFAIGGGFNILKSIDNSFGVAGIPTVNFGFADGDPLSGSFNITTLPGISTTDLGNARALYSLLTGRITSITGSRNVSDINKTYSTGTPLVQKFSGKEFNLSISDSYKVKPNWTLNLGLGWQFQGAFRNTNDIYTSPSYEDIWGISGVKNIFNPGSFSGNNTPKIQLRPGDLYKRDFINPAPSIGISWSPNINNSIFKSIFGESGKSVFRGGYSIAYTREGLAHFSTFAGGSPGVTQTMTLNATTDFPIGSLKPSGAIPPFRQNPTSFNFPVNQSLFTFTGAAVNSYDPNLKTPYVQSWSFGFQRELTNKSAIEIRYVGNHGTRLWRAYNINEVNIFENGFVNEFKNAKKNLDLHIASGTCGKQGQPVCSFMMQTTTPIAGQVALPIFDTAFKGLASDSGFTNGAFITQLNQGQAGTTANALATNPNYLCRLTGNKLAACAARGFSTAGPYAPNIFQVNPDLAGSNIQALTNGSSSTYNSLQVQFTQRLSKGLMLNANYVFSKSLTDYYADSASSQSNYTSLRNPGLDKGPSPLDIRQSFVTNWSYELPFGPGRRWSVDNKVINKMLEGWNLLSIIRVQSGRVFKLTSGRNTVNGSDSGVILNGITVKELQDKINVRKEDGISDPFFVASDLVGSDGRSNRSILDYPTTPGEFGSFIFLYGPKFVKPDFTLSKKTKVTERVYVEFWAEFFNAPNYQNFMIGAPGAAANTVSIDGTSFGKTTQFYNDLGNQEPGPRMMQFRLRIGF